MQRRQLSNLCEHSEFDEGSDRLEIGEVERGKARRLKDVGKAGGVEGNVVMHSCGSN